MPKPSSTAKLFIIRGSMGQIVAAAPAASGKKSNMNVALAPLPGQVMHELDVPDVVLRLPAVDKHEWLRRHVTLGPDRKLVLSEKDLQIRREHD